MVVGTGIQCFVDGSSLRCGEGREAGMPARGTDSGRPDRELTGPVGVHRMGSSTGKDSSSAECRWTGLTEVAAAEECRAYQKDSC